MAGRVLRDSRGRFAGSTKGWMANARKGAGSAKNGLARKIARDADMGVDGIFNKHLTRSTGAPSRSTWKTKSGYGNPILKSRLANVTNARSSRRAKDLVFIERQITLRHTSPMAPDRAYNPAKGRNARIKRIEGFQDKIIRGRKNNGASWEAVPLRGKKIYGAWW